MWNIGFFCDIVLLFSVLLILTHYWLPHYRSVMFKGFNLWQVRINRPEDCLASRWFLLIEANYWYANIHDDRAWLAKIFYLKRGPCFSLLSGRKLVQVIYLHWRILCVHEFLTINLELCIYDAFIELRLKIGEAWLKNKFDLNGVSRT